MLFHQNLLFSTVSSPQVASWANLGSKENISLTYKSPSFSHSHSSSRKMFLTHVPKMFHVPVLCVTPRLAERTSSRWRRPFWSYPALQARQQSLGANHLPIISRLVCLSNAYERHHRRHRRSLHRSCQPFRLGRMFRPLIFTRVLVDIWQRRLSEGP